MPIHLGKGGVAEGVEAMLKEAARQFPTTMQTPDGVLERLSSDVSPLVSLVLIGHSLLALIAALLGGQLSRHLQAGNHGRASGRSSP